MPVMGTAVVGTDGLVVIAGEFMFDVVVVAVIWAVAVDVAIKI